MKKIITLTTFFCLANLANANLNDFQAGNYGNEKLDCGYKVSIANDNDNHLLLTPINNPESGYSCDNGSTRQDLGKFENLTLSCNDFNCYSEEIKDYRTNRRIFSRIIKLKVSSISKNQLFMEIQAKFCGDNSQECNFKTVESYNFYYAHNNSNVKANVFVVEAGNLSTRNCQIVYDHVYAEAHKKCISNGYKLCKEVSTDLSSSKYCHAKSIFEGINI